jgi:ferrous iron transport protein A
VARERPRLTDLRRGQQAVISGFDLPEAFSRRLMELGFLPGGLVTAGRTAPGGDPRVFEVDGSEVAPFAVRLHITSALNCALPGRKCRRISH